MVARPGAKAFRPASEGDAVANTGLIADTGQTGIKRWIAKRSEGDPLVEAAGSESLRQADGPGWINARSVLSSRW